jgi:hypothetical protein
MGEFLDRDFLAAEDHLFSGGSRRCEQGQFAEREIPLFEAKEHFDADGARRTYDRYMGMIHGIKAGVFRRGAEHTSLPPAGNRFVFNNVSRLSQSGAHGKHRVSLKVAADAVRRADIFVRPDDGERKG